MENGNINRQQRAKDKCRENPAERVLGVELQRELLASVACITGVRTLRITGCVC